MTASDSNAAVRLDARGDVVVGGDVVGRDKIVGYTVEQVGVLLTQISATFPVRNKMGARVFALHQGLP